MISQYGRRVTRRKSWFRSSLFSQLVTFTLGAIVGACLYYAYSEIYSEKVQEQQPTAQVDTSPEPVIPAQAVVPKLSPLYSRSMPLSRSLQTWTACGLCVM